MIRQILTLVVRNDPAGSGRFGAPRGERGHNGIDFECVPDALVLSPVDGVVSKLGYAYGDDLRWRIVDVTDSQGFVHRLFYVEPAVDVGDRVTPLTPVGTAQDITKRYPGTEMLPHVHYQVEDERGAIVDPGALAA